MRDDGTTLATRGATAAALPLRALRARFVLFCIIILGVASRAVAHTHWLLEMAAAGKRFSELGGGQSCFS